MIVIKIRGHACEQRLSDMDKLTVLFDYKRRDTRCVKTIANTASILYTMYINHLSRTLSAFFMINTCV